MNWYAVDYHKFFNALARHMKKSAEYITRLMYNGKLLGGMATGNNKPLCFAKFTVFLDKDEQNSGQFKDLCFVKAEIIEPVLKNIYSEKYPDAGNNSDLSGIAGGRQGAVLIHPHYYALAQMFCDSTPLREHVFGTPEGGAGVVGATVPAGKHVVQDPEDAGTSVAEPGVAESGTEPDAMDMIADGACNFADDCIEADLWNESDRCAETPRSGAKRRQVTYTTIGHDNDGVAPEAADDLSAAIAATNDGGRENEVPPTASILDMDDFFSTNEVVLEAAASETGNGGPEAQEFGETGQPSPLSADNNSRLETGQGAAQSEPGGDIPAADTPEETPGQPADAPADAGTTVAPRQAGTPEQSGSVTMEAVTADTRQPDEEGYLDADGMPTMRLAKAMMPLFVKNLILNILPIQINADYCALFIAKNRNMYIARDTAFKYLCLFAIDAGLVPRDMQHNTIMYARLANYWVKLHYLFEKKSEKISVLYRGVALYDDTEGWITDTITFSIPYVVNYQQMSKEISAEDFSDISQLTTKSFEELIYEIHHLRYEQDTHIPVL
jgi:hypothetical protein